MLTIVGGGPGSPGLLTEQAQGALDRADVIFVEAEVRTALGDRRDWHGKVAAWPEERVTPSTLEQAVWLVPGTPALYAPVQAMLETLSPDEWAQIRIVSGVARLTAALDLGGWFLPEHEVRFRRPDGRVLLESQDGELHAEYSRIAWADARPLAGRRVILLRSGRRTRRAVRWLEDWGAEVVLCPVSRLADPDRYDLVDAALRRLERYDWVIFTSAEASDRFFERMQWVGEDIRRLRAKIAVVGPETAMRVRGRGLIPELMPDGEYSQEGLAEAFRSIPLRGSLVLFPGGQLNRTFLAEELRGRGALVDELVLYQNQSEPLSLPLHQAIRTESADAIVYTASSQVEYLVEQLAPEDRRHLAAIPSFSIGPLTTRTLNHYGIEAAREAAQPSVRLLVELVRDYYKEEPHVSD